MVAVKKKGNSRFLVVLTAVFFAAMPSQSKVRNLVDPLEGTHREELNQCAGTMQKYYFPPCGYKEKPQSKSSKRGEILYKKHQCVQCHTIQGHGGELGPALDGIGGARTKAWIKARLVDPEKQMKDHSAFFGGRPNIMPHPGISRDDAQLVASYLLTLKEPDIGFKVYAHPHARKAKDLPASNWQPLPKGELSDKGKELFFSMRCYTCHSVDGKGDKFGPDLAGVGARMVEKQLDKLLSGTIRSSVMKKQTRNLDKEQAMMLKAYLLTLPVAPLPQRMM
jgi:mono/diheme cytochrome c family protein